MSYISSIRQLFRQMIPLAVLVALLVSSICVRSAEAAADPGFRPLFNGKDLSGWDGDSTVWTVKNGLLTGHVPAGKQPRQHLIWTNETAVGDFELRFSFRLVRGTAGVLYRGEKVGKDAVRAYAYSQLVAMPNGNETGVIEETGSGKQDESQFWGRKMLAKICERVVIESSGKIIKKSWTNAGPDDIRRSRLNKDWQEGAIVAKDDHLIHRLNGFVVAEAIDQQSSRSRLKGLLMLRVIGSENNPANDTVVEFKEIRLKQL